MNDTIIKEFEKLLLHIKSQIDNSKDRQEKSKHSFRLRYLSNALEQIKKHDKPIKRGKDISHLSGIGKGAIERIDEIILKGKLSEIPRKNNLQEKHQKYIDDLEEIIGVGRAKAIELINKYDIKSYDELKTAYKNKEIKLSHAIQMGIKYHKTCKDHIPRNEVTKLKDKLLSHIDDVDKKLVGIVCGSYRREKDFSNDIDLIITHPDIKTRDDLLEQDDEDNYLVQYVNLLKEEKFLIDDLTDKDYHQKYMGFCKLKNKPVRRVDIRYVPYESYYSAILYFTGSGEYNKKMRSVAISLGYKLNEYGLFRKKGDRYIRLNITSEKDIFKKLNMEYVKPKDRKVVV